MDLDLGPFSPNFGSFSKGLGICHGSFKHLNFLIWGVSNLAHATDSVGLWGIEMKSLILFVALFLPAISFAGRTVLIIECDNVEVYSNSQAASGDPVTIDFAKGGQTVRETGTLSIRSDGSLVASSASVVVYGNPQGTGYYILAPSRKPHPGNCLSASF